LAEEAGTVLTRRPCHEYLPDGLSTWSGVDDMELETFVRFLKKRYGVDALGFWREDITLGELYARVAQ
jgi:hypothetical protein